jgi:hypothetical protein
MKVSVAARLLAVVLLCIPLAWCTSDFAQRNLKQIKTDPAGYLQHTRSIQHPGFWYQLIVVFILIGGLVFFVEGLAYLIGRLLPNKKQAEEISRIRTTFE